MTYQADGKVVQIQGSVVDVEFPPENLPGIYEAVHVIRPGLTELVIEVQRHLGNNKARCVAMDSTDGLRRGLQCQTHRYADHGTGRERHPRARSSMCLANR